MEGKLTIHFGWLIACALALVITFYPFVTPVPVWVKLLAWIFVAKDNFEATWTLRRETEREAFARMED